MTISRQTTTTKSTSGYSEPVFADDASCLIITSAGWGSATVQVSGDNINWVDLENSNGVVVVTSNKGLQVYGGLFYRINITVYTNPVTISLYRLMR